MSNNSAVTLTLRNIDYQNNQNMFVDDADEEMLSTENGLITFIYFDVKFGSLNIENLMQLKCIPYDKSWDAGDEYTAGQEYFRVLADGTTTEISNNVNDKDKVSLDDAIEAYKCGNIADYLERQKNEQAIMSWEDQDVIMKARADTEKALTDADAIKVNQLVIEITLAMATKANTDSASKEASSLEAKKLSDDINNQGKGEQIDHLLRNGYLAPGIKRHIIPLYLIDDSSQDDSVTTIEKTRNVVASASEVIHYEVNKADWEEALEEHGSEEVALVELMHKLKTNRTFYETEINEVNEEFDVCVCDIG
jgi:hypothetical protein